MKLVSSTVYISFLNAHDQKLEKENLKAVLFTMTVKDMKFLGINLIKFSLDLCAKNWTDEQTKPTNGRNNRKPKCWTDLPCLWIKSFNIFKMEILTSLLIRYSSSQNPSTIVCRSL